MKNDNGEKWAAQRLTRKDFFKWGLLALIVPFFKLWQAMVNFDKAADTSVEELTINKMHNDGVQFSGKVILVKNSDKLSLFSSRCTHLGCRIDKEENGQLVCPCHGSRYDLQGKPLIGPANRPLEEIKFETREVDGAVVLRFKA